MGTRVEILKIQLDFSKNKQILPIWTKSGFEISMGWKHFTMLENEYYLPMWQLVQLQFDNLGVVENHYSLALGCQFLSKFDIVIPKTPLQRYGSLDPKTINNTYNTEENGTATCIAGNAHHIIIGNPLVYIRKC